MPVGTAEEFPVTGSLVSDVMDTDGNTVTGSVAVVCGYVCGHVFGINTHDNFFLVKFPDKKISSKWIPVREHPFLWCDICDRW